MVFEFRLLNDILAKYVTVKAGSFDAVTHERILMMTAIYGGVPVNWGRLLFKIFKDMVTPETRQARDYAVQICILLKNAQGLELVVEKPEDKKTAVSKKRPAPTVDAPVVKRKSTTVKGTPADKRLALVTVAQEAVPIQMISAVTPPAPKRKAAKRRLKLPAGSDDEIVENELDVVDAEQQQREQTTADEICDIVFEDTERSNAVNDEDDNLDGAENEIARKMASFTAPKQLIQEPLRSGEDDAMSGFKQPSAWLRPASRGKRHFTVGGGRLSLIKSTIGCKVPSSACTRRPDEINTDENSSKSWPEQIPTREGDGGVVADDGGFGGGGGGRNFGSWGITDSACKNQLVVVSVQYGPFNPYIPIRSTTIGYPRMSASGESPTTMHRLLHASGPHPIPPPNDPKWVGKRVKVRRLSRRVSMTFRVVRTNQYNQDLGLVHSTNSNHLESPNEGSSIDHQVTIYLHAQNITMFPTNETCNQQLEADQLYARSENHQPDLTEILKSEIRSRLP
ncbi:splicing factor 3B subunit 1-like [Dorcoceras hygrometricum]|uniref:Splicing factor 3B subunit 1-like n=1 Tax=Dorcoceras hygrometricum TaxID=472368 RepID=A0A2Z7B8F5_9LAMI|nr:splicing factor 3B subunit 1-like [Dorcoceras hygrometricum]